MLFDRAAVIPFGWRDALSQILLFVFKFLIPIGHPTDRVGQLKGEVIYIFVFVTVAWLATARP